MREGTKLEATLVKGSRCLEAEVPDEEGCEGKEGCHDEVLILKTVDCAKLNDLLTISALAVGLVLSFSNLRHY